MSNTDQPQADNGQPRTDTEVELEAQAEHRGSRQAFTGLWVILGALAVVIVGAFVLLSHRAHTPALSPGQEQKPSAVALLGGAG